MTSETAIELQGTSRTRYERRLHIFVILAFVSTAATMITAARSRDHHGDFGIYRRASAALYAQPDQSLYKTEKGYVYPPFLAVVLRPLSRLPEPWPGLVWDIARWVCFGLALFFCEQILRKEVSPNQSAVIVLVCLVASLRPMWYDTLNGNTNAFLLFFLVWGWWCIERGRSCRAGAVWAFLLAIKPGSGAVILAPLSRPCSGLTRCWLSCVLLLVILNVLLLAVVFDRASAREQITSFPAGTASTPDDVFARYSNQSLTLGLARVNARLHGQGPADITPSQLAWARWIGAGVLILWVGAMMLRLRREKRGPLKWAVAMLGIFSALLSPVVWITHYLLLIPAYVTLLGEAARRGERWVRGLVIGVMIFVVPLISFKATILNTLIWAPLALLLALTALIIRPDQQALAGRP